MLFLIKLVLFPAALCLGPSVGVLVWKVSLGTCFLFFHVCICFFFIFSLFVFNFVFLYYFFSFFVYVFIVISFFICFSYICFSLLWFIDLLKTCCSLFVCLFLSAPLFVFPFLYWFLYFTYFSVQYSIANDAIVKGPPSPQKGPPLFPPKDPHPQKKHREQHFPNQLWKRHVLCRKFPAGNNSKRLWETFRTTFNGKLS